MPNHCENTLTVTGEKSELQRFKVFAAAGDPSNADEVLNANAFVPMPKNLLEGEGWLAWSIQNWGTK